MPYAYKYRQLTGTGEYSKFSETLSNTELIEREHLNAIRGGTDTCINTKSATSWEHTDNQAMQRMSRGGTTTSIVNSEELASIPQRLAIMIGKYDEWYKERKGNIPREDGNRSIFSQEKYKFFLEAPFEISNKCCNVMKKEPVHRFAKETGKMPITAQMASESRLRTQKWLQNGCNAFEAKNPISNPMSFWTEQDVLLYIKTRNLPICSVYGEVVQDFEAEGQLEGQMDLADYGLFDKEVPLLKTTGCDRTGCVLCGFGCHLEKSPNRFEMLKQTHPKFYNLLFLIKNNGITYAEAIDWINEHGNMNIKY